MSRRKSIDEKIFHYSGYVFISILAFLCLLPFALVISGSVTAEKSILMDGYSLIPREFSIEAYKILFKAPESLLRAYFSTVLITVSGTFAGLFLIAMTAYVLQRRDFKYRNAFSFYFFFTTLFNGGLVPWYILMVRYLGLKNSYLAVILPGLFNVFYIIIMRSFMKQIPDAITESAKIDGAGDFRIFLQLIMPISKPSLATIGLFMALYYWNDWFSAMLFLENESIFPLQYYLYRVLNSLDFANSAVAASGIPMPKMPSESFKLAMTVVATGPIILVFPFVQKYFVKGLTVGAVKG
ncbi:MAG: carbohydrate ABC transporter permease [Spirochaetales bacterium]|nr:carbohydrate ABC transporter permease [Spirochaetales bacterium]